MSRWSAMVVELDAREIIHLKHDQGLQIGSHAFSRSPRLAQPASKLHGRQDRSGANCPILVGFSHPNATSDVSDFRSFSGRLLGLDGPQSSGIPDVAVDAIGLITTTSWRVSDANFVTARPTPDQDELPPCMHALRGSRLESTIHEVNVVAPMPPDPRNQATRHFTWAH